MIAIEHELSLRFDEIQNVSTYLELMENGSVQYQTSFSGHIPVMTCTKAGIVLMLYNAVESTITKCLDKIHQELINNNIKFDDCNDAIQKLIVVYYENAKHKSNDIHSQVPYIITLHNYLTGQCSFGISYDDLSKYYTLYSGNLDSREICNVLKQYGIDIEPIHALKTSELQTIKNYRNQLAHGEKSFEEVGREISRQQLNAMSVKTRACLDVTIEVIKQYLTNQQYKKQH